MAILKILLHPHPCLSTKAEPVEQIDDEIRQLASDMLETMYNAPGVGLAAPQVGVSKRLVVIDLGRPDTPTKPKDWNDDYEFYASNPLKIFNPEIIELSEETAIQEEGCLSVPQIYEDVRRPARCKIKYQDENGTEQTLEATGLLNACIQHEIDHLDGIVFPERLSRLKRDRTEKRYNKLNKQQRINIKYPTETM